MATQEPNCAVDKIRNIFSELNSHFLEREAEIKGCLLALLSGENLLMIGPPGTAKSELTRCLCHVLDDGEIFQYLLTPFTMPEEIFGPYDLQALEEGQYIRKIEGYLPTAHIGFLDEIFKANSSILNSLLMLINERIYFNGNHEIHVPLVSLFGASNELPAKNEHLEALYDRFLIRMQVFPIGEERNVRHLLFRRSNELKVCSSLTKDDIRQIRNSSENVRIPLEVEDSLIELKHAIDEYAGSAANPYSISDRRWRKAVDLLKIAAAVTGEDEINVSYFVLLKNILWNEPEQFQSVNRIINEKIGYGSGNIKELVKRKDGLLHYSKEKGIFNLNETIPASIEIRCKGVMNTGVSSGDKISSYGDLIRVTRENSNCEFVVSSVVNQSLSLHAKEEMNLETLLYKLEMSGMIFTPLNSDTKLRLNHEIRSIVEQIEICQKTVMYNRNILIPKISKNFWLSTSEKDEILSMVHSEYYEEWLNKTLEELHILESLVDLGFSLTIDFNEGHCSNLKPVSFEVR